MLYNFVFFKFPALCQSRGYALIFGSHTAPGAVIDVQGAGNGDLGSPLAAGFQHLRHVLLWDHVFGLAGASPRQHRSRSAVFGTVFIIMACAQRLRSEEHTSELQSLMRISYAVFCLKKK